MKWLRRKTPSGLFTIGKLYPVVCETETIYTVTSDLGERYRLLKFPRGSYVGWEVVDENSMVEKESQNPTNIHSG